MSDGSGGIERALERERDSDLSERSNRDNSFSKVVHLVCVESTMHFSVSLSVCVSMCINRVRVLSICVLRQRGTCVVNEKKKRAVKMNEIRNSASSRERDF